jgi:hypothetical protein
MMYFKVMSYKAFDGSNKKIYKKINQQRVLQAEI